MLASSLHRSALACSFLGALGALVSPESVRACSGIASSGAVASTAPAGGVLEVNCFYNCSNGSLRVMDADSQQPVLGRFVVDGLSPGSDLAISPNASPIGWALWKPDQPFRIGQRLKATLSGISSGGTDVTIVAADASDATDPAPMLSIARVTELIGTSVCCDHAPADNCPPRPTSVCYADRRSDQAVLNVSAALPGGALSSRPIVSRQWVYRVAHGPTESSLSEDATPFLAQASIRYEFDRLNPVQCISFHAENMATGEKVSFATSCVTSTLQDLGERAASTEERDTFLVSCTTEPTGFHQEWCAVQTKHCRPGDDAGVQPSALSCTMLSSLCGDVPVDAGVAAPSPASIAQPANPVSTAPALDAGGPAQDGDASNGLSADGGATSVVDGVIVDDSSGAVQRESDEGGCALRTSAGDSFTGGLCGLLGLFLLLRRRPGAREL